MILYVPFPRSQAGDLISAVESWKKEQNKLSIDSVHIIYHGDDVDFDAEPVLPSEIYICAHGFSDSYPFVVGNNGDITKTDFINIQIVADRFNQDFGSVFHQIDAIHLYCCGSQGKNQQMAELLRMGLMRNDISIHSYDGAITTPDSNGVRWSFSSNQTIPVHRTESVLFKQDNSEMPSCRVGIKTEVIQRFLEEAKETRRYDFFARGKAARQEEIYRRRHSSPMDEYPTNTAISSRDNISAMIVPRQ